MALSWAERVQASVPRRTESVPRSAVSEDTVGESCSSTPSSSPSWEVLRREEVTGDLRTVALQVEEGDDDLLLLSRTEEDAVTALECDQEVIEPEGDLVVVNAQDMSWYQEAMRDLENYMARMREEAGEKGEEGEEEEEGKEGDEEWAPRAVTGRRKFEGEMYVKVQWRSHPEATWELEDDFIDQGHQPLIQAYLGSRQQQTPPAPRGPPRVREDPNFCSRFWPDFPKRIQSLFQDCRLTLTGIEQLPVTPQLKSFARRVEQGAGVPVMLTHGTQSKNIPGIVQSGLVVPTNNGPVRVANGSAYGVGIYTARNPAVSVGYTRGSQYMFVCAGLVREDVVVKQVNDTVVFFNADDVVPCFLVSYDLGWSENIPVKVQMYDKKKVRASAVPARLPFARPVVTGPPQSRTVRSAIRAGGEVESKKHQVWDSSTPNLSKKAMRSQPRAVKDAYKRGLLTQKSSKK